MKLFEHINYQGTSLDIASDTPDLRKHGASWNDQASSVKVPAGTTVTLYQHINYEGASLVLTADAPDLRAFPGPGSDGTWNDAASSVKVAGAQAGGTERLRKGSGFVECNAAGTVFTNVQSPTDFGKVVVTRHDDKHYDARFTKANLTLSIDGSGELSSRPAGTYGGFEQLDAITAPDPNQVNLLYRVADGKVCGGTVLQIVKE